jgi:hypothetical protein
MSLQGKKGQSLEVRIESDMFWYPGYYCGPLRLRPMHDAMQEPKMISCRTMDARFCLLGIPILRIDLGVGTESPLSVSTIASMQKSPFVWRCVET